jgi:hypothetical protein
MAAINVDTNLNTEMISVASTNVELVLQITPDRLQSTAVFLHRPIRFRLLRLDIGLV